MITRARTFAFRWWWIFTFTLARALIVVWPIRALALALTKTLPFLRFANAETFAFTLMSPALILAAIRGARTVRWRRSIFVGATKASTVMPATLACASGT